jgi:hypothetical protein
VVNAGLPSDAALKDSVARRKSENAKADADKLLERLKNARVKANDIAGSEQLTKLRNFRDKYVAHSLVQTKLDKKGEISLPNYGEEKELLDKTIDVVHDLYYGICDASFHWDSAWANSRLCAEALFGKCQLNITA